MRGEDFDFSGNFSFTELSVITEPCGELSLLATAASGIGGGIEVGISGRGATIAVEKAEGSVGGLDKGRKGAAGFSSLFCRDEVGLSGPLLLILDPDSPNSRKSAVFILPICPKDGAGSLLVGGESSSESTSFLWSFGIEFARYSPISTDSLEG